MHNRGLPYLVAFIGLWLGFTASYSDDIWKNLQTLEWSFEQESLTERDWLASCSSASRPTSALDSPPHDALKGCVSLLEAQVSCQLINTEFSSPAFSSTWCERRELVALKQGNVAFSLGNYKQAVAYWSTEPESPAYINFVLQRITEENRLNEAQGLLNATVDVQEAATMSTRQEMQRLILTSRIAARTNDWERVVFVSRRIVELNEADINSRIELAEGLRRLGRTEESLWELQTTLNYNPTQIQKAIIFESMGYAYEQMGECSEATTNFREALVLFEAQAAVGEPRVSHITDKILKLEKGCR